MCAYLLTLNMASNFISDLSSFSNGAKSLFNLDSTKNPYQNKSYQKFEKEKYFCNNSNRNEMIYRLFVWYINKLHVELKWEKRRICDALTNWFITQNFQHTLDSVGRDLGQ